jgi:hypothetical protein
MHFSHLSKAIKGWVFWVREELEGKLKNVTPEVNTAVI